MDNFVANNYKIEIFSVVVFTSQQLILLLYKFLLGSGKKGVL